MVSQWLALDDEAADTQQVAETDAASKAEAAQRAARVLDDWDAVEETASEAVEAAEDEAPKEADKVSSDMVAGKPPADDGYDLEIRARAERAIAASGTHVTAEDGTGAPESAAEMLVDEAVLDQMREDTGEDIVRMLVTSFLEELEERLPKVVKLCEVEYWSELRHEAHTIKGSAATFGAAALSRAAKRIEVACDDTEYEQAKADVGDFPALAQKTRDSLVKTLKLQLPSKKEAA